MESSNMRTEGILDFKPLTGQLRSTSPTGFLSMQECAIREVWGANRTERLLPTWPAARLGTITHKILEMAGRGELEGQGEEEVAALWDGLLERAEEEMSKWWLERHLAPIRSSVADFEVRRLQAIGRANELKEKKASRPQLHPEAGFRLGFEVPVASPSRKVRGFIDQVMISDDSLVLRDFKSGAIFENLSGNERALKVVYATQLRMYAALYSMSYGHWPTRLEVVPLSGSPEGVSVDQKECLTLIERATELLDDVNRRVARNPAASDELASPSPTACQFCSYRPGCRPYRLAKERSDEDKWPSDFFGKVTAISSLANNHLMVTARNAEAGLSLTVRGLSPGERHPALAQLSEGDSVSMFNLGRTSSPSTFRETQYTTIYKESDADRSESGIA